MRKEYDFSNGVRGKFYKKEAELRMPIYLENKLQGQIEIIAKKKGKDIGVIVNQLLRRELDLIEDFK